MVKWEISITTTNQNMGYEFIFIKQKKYLSIMRDFNFFCLFLFSTLNKYHLYKKIP